MRRYVPVLLLIVVASATVVLLNECADNTAPRSPADALPDTEGAAADRRALRAAPEDVRADAPEDTCGVLTQLVADGPTEETLPLLMAVLESLPGECGSQVPESWQIAAANWACRSGAPHGTFPGSWAMQALKAATSEGQDVLGCLVGHAAEVGQLEARELARILVRLSADKRRIGPSGRGVRADEEFVAVLQELLRARPPEDIAWWRSFWEGMRASGEKLRPYLYLAAGREAGFDALRSFIESSIEWEDWSQGVSNNVAMRAGWVLRDFRAGVDLSVRDMFPESARMRRVLMSSIPIMAMAPHVDVPWLGSDAAQARLSQFWLESTGSDADGDQKGWRVDYIANQWDLTGDIVALRDLRTVFAESDEPIQGFDDEQWIRFATGLRAYSDRISGVRRRYAGNAPAIRAALEAAIQRATPQALQELTSRLRGHLADPDLRAIFSSMVQDRLHELPDKVGSGLTK